MKKLFSKTPKMPKTPALATKVLAYSAVGSILFDTNRGLADGFVAAQLWLIG